MRYEVEKSDYSGLYIISYIARKKTLNEPITKFLTDSETGIALNFLPSRKRYKSRILNLSKSMGLKAKPLFLQHEQRNHPHQRNQNTVCGV